MNSFDVEIIFHCNGIQDSYIMKVVRPITLEVISDRINNINPSKYLVNGDIVNSDYLLSTECSVSIIL